MTTFWIALAVLAACALYVYAGFKAWPHEEERIDR
jgi:hypothetical protein